MTKRWDPSLWASKVPFGLGEQRPNNYLEIWKAIRENSDNLPYALRILNHGVCDGCSLGTRGMRDWTLDKIHLCNIRLRLLRLNTMPAIDSTLLRDVSGLRRKSSTELRGLGRLAHPMVRRAGDKGFERVSWSAALDLIADSIKTSRPERLGFYLTSRGVPNENYFAAQKAARAMGSNAIDNAARVCHSPAPSPSRARSASGRRPAPTRTSSSPATAAASEPCPRSRRTTSGRRTSASSTASC
jgi:anaerobic selenocysteine-containing dehydrogenase